MTEIVDIIAREILDSRGNPTVEVDVYVDAGVFGRARAPSGASTGQREAVELRDKDPSRFGGKGVLRAVHAVRERIAPELIGRDAADQAAIDNLLIELDGTSNKESLGANAIVAVSLACARAAAEAHGQPLYRYLGGVAARTVPLPMLNVVNGGAHADNPLDVQEFMLVPLGFERFADALRAAVEVYHTLKGLLHAAGKSTAVGDEGGFAPALEGARQVLTFLVQAIEKAGYEPGPGGVAIALDVAASELYDAGAARYRLPNEGLDGVKAEALVSHYEALCDAFPIVAIEDGMAENDWDGWALLTERLGERIELVGDDIFVTNRGILAEGIERGVANAVLIKPNQIGTLTETLETIALAHRAGYRTVVSHRSGETEDTTIADLAVAIGTGAIKTGAPCRGERTAKYNQLLRIEEELGEYAQYAGADALVGRAARAGGAERTRR